MTATHFGFILLAYIVGSIPVGVIVARAKGVDIMSVGSGNIGATNVMRILGKGPGLLVFALDVLKGALPAGLASYFLGAPEFSFLTGIVAVLGHSFSPWLKFKGGKGIATGLGALLGSSPLVAVSAFSIFVICLAITKYVSLSSIIAAISLVICGFVFGASTTLLAGYLAMAAFVIVRHKPNIQRLRSGTESKFSWKAKLSGGNSSISTDEPAASETSSK